MQQPIHRILHYKSQKAEGAGIHPNNDLALAKEIFLEDTPTSPFFPQKERNS